ncbi:GntR family transcriptional regulator [Glutamicibacter endophyticus]|uniref:GntR family transcriptional regulator n=1 Tax=Glutamicibacter endophyticus TaxID=1522174 RepID=UPI003AF142AE
MSIMHNSQITAPERAYRWLRQQIGELPYNQEAFLSENAIAEAAGVSRTPVREALLRLEAEGLLRRVPHKGAYIPALTGTDLKEILEVRQVIGEWATRQVAEHRVDLVPHLEAILEQQAQTTDPVAFIELDIAFHRTIVEGAGNSTLAQVYDAQRFKQERLGIQAVLATTDRFDAVLVEHRAIVAGIKAGNPDQAAQAALSHLESTRKAVSTQRSTS